MGIKRVAHVCLGALDLEATEKFYCQGLGCTKTFNFVRGGKVIGFYLAAGDGGFIEVFRQDQIDPKASAPIRHICLEVASCDQIAAHLKGLGYKVTDKKLGADQSWQVWTADPAGVQIEFHEYTPQSSQFTKKDCILG